MPYTLVVLKGSQMGPWQLQWGKATDHDHEAHLPESQGDTDQGQKVGKVNEAGEGQDRRISETVAMPVNYGAKAVFILY